MRHLQDTRERPLRPNDSPAERLAQVLLAREEAIERKKSDQVRGFSIFWIHGPGTPFALTFSPGVATHRDRRVDDRIKTMRGMKSDYHQKVRESQSLLVVKRHRNEE